MMKRSWLRKDIFKPITILNRQSTTKCLQYVYYIYRSPRHTKIQEVCQQEQLEGHQTKPQYQESDFGCRRYLAPHPQPSPEHKMHKNTTKVNNMKDNNSHINKAFAGDYTHKVRMSNSKKRPHHIAAGLCGGNDLIETSQDPVSACLRSPCSIVSLSDDEICSLADSGVETTSKQGSWQNIPGQSDFKKKVPILKTSNNRSNCVKRPVSLDVPLVCQTGNDVHDTIVL